MGIFDFLANLHGKFVQQCESEIRPCDELLEAVDLVVKMSHPNIHYVSNYRKKLMPAVEYTLQYADELIAMMPPPVSVDADSWDTNPFIRVAFVNNSKFRKFFSENREIEDFLKKTNSSGCCALLIMDRMDKNIFGAELEGEIIKRDVLKTCVNFSHHQIVTPAISEVETRKNLSLNALSLLATQALEDILFLIEWKKEMETEKRVLEIQLQIHNANVRSRNSFLPDTPDTGDIKEASEMLEQLDRKIAETRARIDEPEDYLGKVMELLYHPEQFLKSEPVKMIVDDMNIIVKNSNHGRADEICFTEFSDSKGTRKAAVLVDYKKF